MEWMIWFWLFAALVAAYMGMWSYVIRRVRERMFLQRLEQARLVGEVRRQREGRRCGTKQLVFRVLYKDGRIGRCKIEADSPLLRKMKGYIV